MLILLLLPDLNYFRNSGKEPLRQTLKQFYKDPNIYENANFQLYQQNEMLKVQNFNFIEKNKDLINEELEKKLTSLNSSLIDVQKENIYLKELVDQYSKLIKNIENCSESWINLKVPC
ncbi:hypothetical protein [Plasmodium yoelii yoelii]|uniref:Uncharacterized protein n=1 Tax=Plasmodium yoelii yoelii TaxID=73239 RepID=Q7RAV7_PLAYO|nr:hypothetical protein [Plasmodium yoelii yoelii]